MKSLAVSVSKLAAPLLGKRGFGEAEIILEWVAVVGEEMARDCLPVKLAFPKGERSDGTLHLRVVPAAALEIRHREPQILDRVNTFFGYNAVARLKLSQGPLPSGSGGRKEAPRLPPPSPAEASALAQRLDGIADPDLRAALEGWGRAVLGSTAAEANEGATDPQRHAPTLAGRWKNR